MGSLDTSSRECKEVCLSVAKMLMLSFSGLLDSRFELAKSGSCADLGYPVLNATLVKGIEPAAFVWDLYTPQLPGTTTLRKVAAGICGQMTLRDEDTAMLGPLHLEHGTCADLGYTETMDSQLLPGPGVLEGKEILLFRKSGDIDLIDGFRLAFNALALETVTLYKVMGHVCSEASVDKKIKQAVSLVGGLSEGSCSAHGYTMPAGSQSLTVPLVPTVL